MADLSEMAQRFVYTGTEGPTDRPACGPKPSDCRQQLIAIGSGVGGWNVYKCPKCGDEEWL